MSKDELYFEIIRIFEPSFHGLAIRAESREGRADMNKKNLDIAYFLSFCIEQYKEAKHLSGAEAAKIFDRYGVLEYLEQHFEPVALYEELK